MRFLKFIRGKKKKKKLRSFSHVEETHTHTREDPHPGLPFGFFFSPFLLVARRLTTSRRACFGEFELEEEEEEERE